MAAHQLPGLNGHGIEALWPIEDQRCDIAVALQQYPVLHVSPPLFDLSVQSDAGSDPVPRQSRDAVPA